MAIAHASANAQILRSAELLEMFIKNPPSHLQHHPHRPTGGYEVSAITIA
jgi:hypothetical protein